MDVVQVFASPSQSHRHHGLDCHPEWVNNVISGLAGRQRRVSGVMQREIPFDWAQDVLRWIGATPRL